MRKETTDKPSNLRPSKNIFSCVYVIGMLLLIFIIVCDNYIKKVYRYSEDFPTAMLLSSLKEVFRKRSVFYVISTITVPWKHQTVPNVPYFSLRRAYTMKFFFHNLEIFILKEKCRNISGSEMCVVKYYSVCSHNQISIMITFHS